jgi:DNA-binding transcriptional ArsR family regulator
MNEVFKALSDPTRRKFLELLKGKDLTAGEELIVLVQKSWFHLRIPNRQEN